MQTPNQLEVTRLADQLERSFHGGAWHGPALAEAVAGSSADEAVRRASPGVHTILEIVRHTAFWLDGARRRIGGEAVTGLAPEADWPAEGPHPEAKWQAALDELAEAHRRLHAAVLALSDAQLDAPATGSDPTVRGLLVGVLQHNAYHAGQIAILAKLGAGSRR